MLPLLLSASGISCQVAISSHGAQLHYPTGCLECLRKAMHIWFFLVSCEVSRTLSEEPNSATMACAYLNFGYFYTSHSDPAIETTTLQL